MTRVTVVLAFAILFSVAAYFLNTFRFNVERCTTREYFLWVAERLVLAMAMSLSVAWCLCVSQSVS